MTFFVHYRRHFSNEQYRFARYNTLNKPAFAVVRFSDCNITLCFIALSDVIRGWCYLKSHNYRLKCSYENKFDNFSLISALYDVMLTCGCDVRAE